MIGWRVNWKSVDGIRRSDTFVSPGNVPRSASGHPLGIPLDWHLCEDPYGAARKFASSLQDEGLEFEIEEGR